jgi:acyl-CoA synthetase (AMP-forming)/AMP-acid ligase II
VPPPATNVNIARHLAEMAARHPNRTALKVPRGRTSAGEIDYLALSFIELQGEVEAWHVRLATAGLRQGDRTLVMVRQGLPLIASVFALFKLGAVPIIIDPGMGLRSFLACVERSRPRALIGIPLAQIVSRVARRAFSPVQIRIAASSSLTSRLCPENSLSRGVGGSTGVCANAASAVPFSQVSNLNSQLAVIAPTDLAAVLFTSGSTGAPKGVCYEHGMFEAQIRLIGETYAIQAGEIDLPMLPIFALFNPALGMTTIVPEIDPRRPAAVDPAKIVQAIQQENVTNSFGSPTLWRKIGDYCVARKITFPSLRRVLCAGAPVPAALWESACTWMPDGRLHSPYGATEALPVSTISSDEQQTANWSRGAASFGLNAARAPHLHKISEPGIGACVGRPVAATEVKIIAITDTPIGSLTDARELPQGEIGEIIVAGPTVTKTYDAAPEATAAAKIEGFGSRLSALDSQLAGGEAVVWHRMGDCGYLDRDGRLWFVGRKSERVVMGRDTMFTEPCEQVFRAHPRVSLCALIGVGPRGQQQPALVVESAVSGMKNRTVFARELRELARANPATADITRFYFRPKFPVDIRHNAKIHRLALARWAATTRACETEA